MRKLMISFNQFLSQASKDPMLTAACTAPFLCGLMIKFGIPFLENKLVKYFGAAGVLSPYYLIFDLFLAAIASIMLCFVSAMIILEETDEHIANYIFITPLRKRGYLISRLVFPTIIAAAVSFIVLEVFALNRMGIFMYILLSILTSVTGMIISLLIVSIASNKVEGMAVAKLSGFFIFGLPAPFFIKGNIQYMLSILPSFWIAKFALCPGTEFFLITAAVSAIWIMVLFKNFQRKLL